MQTQGQMYENAFSSGTFVPNANGSSQPQYSTSPAQPLPTYNAPLSPSYGAVTAPVGNMMPMPTYTPPLSPSYGSVPAPVMTSPVQTYTGGYSAPLSPQYGVSTAPVTMMAPTTYPVSPTTYPVGSPTTYPVTSPVTQYNQVQYMQPQLQTVALGEVEEVTNWVPMQVQTQIVENVPITAPLTYVEPTPIYEAMPMPIMESPPPPPPQRRVAEQPVQVQRAAPPPEPEPVRVRKTPPPERKQRAAAPPPPAEIEKIVEVEKIVHVPVVEEVERIVEVPVEVERIVYQDREVPVTVEVEKVVTVDRTIEVPIEVEKIVQVPVDKIVQVPVERVVEKIVEKEVPVERRIEVPVPYPVDRIVEKIVEVPVEKIVYKEVPVPVQMSPERVVVKEVPVPIEVVREVPVPVEKVVYKEVPVGVQMGQHMEIRQHERVQVGQREHTYTDGPQYALQQFAASHSPQQIQYQTSPGQYQTQQFQTSPQQMQQFMQYQPQYQTSPPQALYSTSQMFQSSPGTRISQQQLSSPQAVYSTLPGDLSNLSLRSPGGMAGTNLYGSQQAAAGSRRVGLGLVLERNDANRSIVIRDLVPDFAAHRSGKVQRGDILLAVDAEPTTGYDLDQIKYLTSGEDGSQVMLDLLRNGARVQVPLVRSGPGGGGGGGLMMPTPEAPRDNWGGELAC